MTASPTTHDEPRPDGSETGSGATGASESSVSSEPSESSDHPGSELDDRGLTVSRPWAAIIRSMAFTRKELTEIVRQPRLVALLVAGPFALLLLFGAGYSGNRIEMATLFVGPAESIYEERLQDEETFGRYVENLGYTTDREAALDRLAAGEADAVVVFPADPVETVLGGERAVIEVYHDEIDPIRRTAIAIASRLAIQEVNSSVLSAIAGEGQELMAPAVEIAEQLAVAADRLESDDADADAAASALASLDAASSVLDGSSVVLSRLRVDDQVLDAFDEIRSTEGDLRDRLAALESSPSDRASVASELRAFATTFEDAAVVDPEVLVRPFDSETSSIVPVDVDPLDFFAPSSLALLLQHLAVTFAALSLVRDRSGGLFELLRVGPMSSFQVLVGKTIAYLVIGLVVAAALLGAAIGILGVPLAGAVVDIVPVTVGVVLGALALGLLLSLLSGTESQAVQFAMLALLAGMFFGGFILSTDDLAYPVKAISWTMPVTYGIRAFQGVMLRGEAPHVLDLVGLYGLTLVYGALAVVLLRRRLATS